MRPREIWNAPSLPAVMPVFRSVPAPVDDVSPPASSSPSPAEAKPNSSRRHAAKPSILLRVALAMVMTSLAFVLAFSWSPKRAPEPEATFLQEHPVVVASDHLVCSMAGGQQQITGIEGQDGGHSVEVDGVVYWNFGDTVLASGALIPNSLAWSADINAADCISLVPKGKGGIAVSLLTRDASELTVWPLGMEATSDDTVHFFYASVVGSDLDNWQVAGVGLASFNTKTLTASRAFDGALPWPAGLPQPMRTVRDAEYVYVILGAEQDAWETATMLARVPVDDIESLEEYEYWQPPSGLATGQWLGGLWEAETGSWAGDLDQIGSLWSQPGRHNGVEVAYNEFLDRWLGIYASGFMTSISVRAAQNLTGPWDGPEATLIDCPAFHSPVDDGFVCYSGAQQETYTRDGGRTIYVSYSNGANYEVYLHELRLASAIQQWNDNAGRAVYIPRSSEAQDGYSLAGLAFYASDVPVPGFLPIHRWAHPASHDIRYGAIAPSSHYVDLGIDFYAPVDDVGAQAANAFYAPVYRWTSGGQSRYAALDLERHGYERQELAFFAACPDADSDGLTDCDESFLGTDALVADTDGDGLPDGYEHNMPGCDPTVFNDDRDGTSSLEELFLGLNPCVWGAGVREVTSNLHAKTKET